MPGFLAATTADLQPTKAPTFYTGKLADSDTGAYLFKYRNYDPELSRWTVADPSGFPDGANNRLCVENRVTTALDPNGLTTYTYGYTYTGYYRNTGGPGPFSMTFQFAAQVASLATTGLTSNVISAISSGVATLSNRPPNYAEVTSLIDKGWESTAGEPPVPSTYVGLERTAGSITLHEDHQVYFPHDASGNPVVNSTYDNFFDPLNQSDLAGIIAAGETPTAAQWACSGSASIGKNEGWS